MSKYTTELRFIVQNTSREEVESWFMDYELSDYLTEEEIADIVSSWSGVPVAQLTKEEKEKSAR